MDIARRALLALALGALVVCSWLAPMDAPAMARVDAGLKRALVSFATARVLNAAISVAQGTEARVQPFGFGVTLAPGQVLDPVNDLVEQFSNLMLAASVVFGIQKVLIAVGGYWPLLREALKTMGRADLIGNGKHHLIPTFQPLTDGTYTSARRKNSTPLALKTVTPVKGRLLTQHTGLPPRDNGSGKPGGKTSLRKPR